LPSNSVITNSVIITEQTFTAHFNRISIDMGFRLRAASRIRARVSDDSDLPLLIPATCCRPSSD
jgi:hypothetical protein